MRLGTESLEPCGELMEDTRRSLISKLTDRLGARKLVWVGTRGHDAVSLLELPQFSESYSIIAPLGAVSLPVDFALEEVSRHRVDLDTYNIDEDWSLPAQELRTRLLNSLNEPTVIMAYRPFALLSALCYPRSAFVTYLGMFHERQAVFEHKPWVESELRKFGVPVIPWKYFADADRTQLEEEIAALGTVVLRTNRSDGGAGLKVISSSDQISAAMPKTKDGFFAAAPYLKAHVSVNINVCVFGDGSLTLHPPSVQLIGIEECTRRRFGYCGNDFAAIKDLDPRVLSELESVTRKSGQWLYSQGYLGAFGLDALVRDGEVLLTEINPRFQGSSLLSARIDKQLERPSVFFCHLAAYLRLPAPSSIPLVEIVRAQTACSQILLHNNQGVNISGSSGVSANGNFEIELSPSPLISVHPNATVLRAISTRQVTRDGQTLDSLSMQSLAAHFALTSPDKTSEMLEAKESCATQEVT